MLALQLHTWRRVTALRAQGCCAQRVLAAHTHVTASLPNLLAPGSCSLSVQCISITDGSSVAPCGTNAAPVTLLATDERPDAVDGEY